MDAPTSTPTPPSNPSDGGHRPHLHLPANGTGLHPVVRAEALARRGDLQLRLADAVTAFAGSMPFVYLHVAAFAAWMLLAESSPWPTLTLVVSLEAIFLSTFVMIGQNRQSAFAQAKADHDFVEQEMELRTNTDLTRATHDLLGEVRRSISCPHVCDACAALAPPT